FRDAAAPCPSSRQSSRRRVRRTAGSCRPYAAAAGKRTFTASTEIGSCATTLSDLRGVMAKNKYGTYFGVNVSGGHFNVFDRGMRCQRKLPGWKQDTVPCLGTQCMNGQEIAWQIDDVIKDLERLKRWAVRYSESEDYKRDKTKAWTR